MGREIVYCWKCQTRLQTSDFESRKAFRSGDKISCEECVFELVADLPAEEQEAVLSGEAPPRASSTKVKVTRTGSTQAVKRTTGAVPKSDGGTGRRGTGPIPTGTRALKRTTGSVPKAPPPDGEEGDEVAEDPAAKKKKLILVLAGGGGFLVVAVVAVILLLGGEKKPDPEETFGPRPPGPKAAKAVDPKVAREEATKKAFEDAMVFFKSEPENLGGQMKQFRAALEVGKETFLADQILRQIEIVGLKIRERVDAVSEECKTHFPAEKFKAIFDLLEQKKALHDVPEWQEAIDKIATGYRGISEERYRGIVRGAKDALEQGSGEKVKDFLARLEKWEVAEYIEKFNQELGTKGSETAANPADANKPKTPGKPVRKPPSADLQKYLPAWQRAMGAAFGRDYDQATVEIRRTAKDIESDEVKKESEADVKALETVKALVEETLKLLPNKGRGQRITLEHFDGPTTFKEVAGKVMAVNDQRFEIKSDGKDGKEGPTVFVEFADLTGKSLVELNKARKGKLDPLAAAFLNFIEGNEEAAKLHGGQAANKVPDRYWEFVAEAKEKAPKSNTKEYDARNAFHGAELDWRDVKTWGTAFEKYRLLTNEYAGTSIVRKNQSLILKRSGMGKDYFYFPHQLTANFNFKLQKQGDPFVLSTAEAEGRDILENYVEANFYALPGTAYRCWAYVAACCKETFAFYYQTTEGKTRDAGKDVAIDPGSLALAPVPHQLSGLKDTHDSHRPKDPKDPKAPKPPHPKTQARWEWIPIPLPKNYAGHGAKAVRLCTNHAGFGVRFIIISSTRTKTPDEKETAEFMKESVAAREEAAAAAPKITGTPEPVEWLVAGPFDNGLNRAFPPEQEIDVDKEMQGKAKKNVKWEKKPAQLRDSGGGKAAVFDFAALFNPKEQVNGYALIHVKAPAAMDAKLLLGRDDGIKVWVRETMIHSSTGGGMTVDKETANIKLEEGWNRILVKVHNGTGAWSFSFRIADAAKKPIPGLEYHPYGDLLVGP